MCVLEQLGSQLKDGTAVYGVHYCLECGQAVKLMRINEQVDQIIHLDEADGAAINPRCFSLGGAWSPIGDTRIVTFDGVFSEAPADVPAEVAVIE
jgi:hypothetical protein